MRSWLRPTDVGGAALAFDDRGEGPAVLLLHGQPGDRRDWDQVAARLVGRARVVIPDRPGYGRTGGSAAGYAANARALISMLDDLGVERAVVAGHSWGGGVALQLALDHPERVGALVLVGSVGGEGSVGDLDRLLAAPIVGPALAATGLAILDAPRFLPAWRSFMIEQRAMLAEMSGIGRRLGEIASPAVVLVGAGDRVVPAASQEALAAALPNAEVVSVAGGHLLPREVPDLIADVIIAALP